MCADRLLAEYIEALRQYLLLAGFCAEALG
jgi:hypothetical protein